MARQSAFTLNHLLTKLAEARVQRSSAEKLGPRSQDIAVISILEFEFVDWMAILTVLSLVGLILAADSEILMPWRRHAAIAMLMLGGGLAYMVLTTDSGGSFFFGGFASDESIARARRLKNQPEPIETGDSRDPDKDASGPGDGNGGANVELALAAGDPDQDDGAQAAASKGKGKTASDGAGGKTGDKADSKAGAANTGQDSQAGLDDDDEAGGAAGDAASKSKSAGGNRIKEGRDCPLCPVMVRVPAGTLVLGGEQRLPGFRRHEGPLQKVTISRAFWIGRAEITQLEFAGFLEKTGHKPVRGCVIGAQWRRDASFQNPGLKAGPDHPAVCINWRDAQAYVRWLSTLTSRTYRLPSESDWEFAARGGNPRNFNWGDEIRISNANFGLVHGGTTAVARYKPYAFGLFDTSGNVWEWVQDCWASDIRSRPADGKPYLASPCQARVIRGGGWHNSARYLRSASRWSNPAAAGGNGVGFRVLRDILSKTTER